MNTVWLVIMILILYFLIRIFRKGSNPLEFKTLEATGNKYYLESLRRAQRNIEEYTKKLRGETKNKELVLPNLAKEIIENSQNQVIRLGKAHKDFTHLKERYKHSPIQIRKEIYQDWADYGKALNEYQHEGEQLEYALDGEWLNEIYKNMDEQLIIIDEIERRFKQKLAGRKIKT